MTRVARLPPMQVARARAAVRTTGEPSPTLQTMRPPVAPVRPGAVEKAERRAREDKVVRPAAVAKAALPGAAAPAAAPTAAALEMARVARPAPRERVARR